ncbi:unnamed protein product [Linum trigynum]|uniref:Pentatricopeptide repeat-containing protein n=1 Tax=Linum trigynum TaxID=586398 RepID=A0AAV2EIB0_9ROSI
MAAPTHFFKTVLNAIQILAANPASKRKYSAGAARAASSDLFTRISPIGDPETRLAPVLDQWVEEGRKFRDSELQRIARKLRSWRRHGQALEVLEWMVGRGVAPLSQSDHAVHLDLIGKVRGFEFAEGYFTSLDETEKTQKMYGALLNCYIRQGQVTKSLSLWEKMQELGFDISTLNYNEIMTLYLKTGLPEKVTGLLTEMKDKGISPDCVSYRICMTAYAAMSQLDKVQQMLQEMEEEQQQPLISIDWLTYSTVAGIYIKAGLQEASLECLRKCEERVKKNADGFNHLISHHANLGNKDEVLRLWGVAKAKFSKRQNRDYLNMMGSLVKLGELEEAEILLEEWDSACEFYDARVPNALLIGCCQKGLVEKAELLLRDRICRGKAAIPNSWAIIAAGYVEKEGNMEKGFEAMREALAIRTNNIWWRPKPVLMSRMLRWAGENIGAEEVESFVGSVLQTKVPKDREFYNTLLHVYVRNGKEVGWILDGMKADGIDGDEATGEILSSVKQ